MPGYHCSGAGGVLGGSAGVAAGEGTATFCNSCGGSLVGGVVCRGVATNWDMLPTSLPKRPRRGVVGAAMM